MLIHNVLIYGENHGFEPGAIRIQDGMIYSILDPATSIEGADAYDGQGLLAIPGLVDIHFHGCNGVDLCDALPDGIARMAKYESRHGITTICPATMSMSVEELEKIMKTVGSYDSQSGAWFAGINMEGPFINKEKKGSQAEENIIPCDFNLFQNLQKEACGRIRMVDLAPEIQGAMDFIQEVRDQVVVSLAHTKADYDTAMAAMKAGADHVTHLCNAMSGLHHREPGVIGAALDSGAYVEVIGDGIHIHPAMIRAIFAMFQADKICLISDSMRATGLGDGTYTLGGQQVIVKGKRASLEDGTIAGSVSNLMDCLVHVVKEMGIPLEVAVRCASENPARSIGIFDSCGSLSPGKRGDLVLLNQDLEIKQVFLRGNPLFHKE